MEQSQSWFGQKRQYLTEVQGEFNKITWPPQSETVNGAAAVVVVVVLIASFLGIVDFALSRLIQQVLG